MQSALSRLSRRHKPTRFSKVTFFFTPTQYAYRVTLLSRYSSHTQLPTMHSNTPNTLAAAAANSGAYEANLGAGRGSAYQGAMTAPSARNYKHTHSILFNLKSTFEGQLRYVCVCACACV